MATTTERAQKPIERANDLQNPTPMMAQYLEIKRQYPDFILLYRLGDFFEMFFEDAVTVSRELELTLTGRDCGDGNRAAMCGVPFHKSDLYIGKLVELGHKVAVCEQTEDPANAKGLVRREIVRVVTPGTITDGSLLQEQRNNYLAAVCRASHGDGIAFADISTGQVSATYLTGADREARLLDELGTYAPRELLCNLTQRASEEFFSPLIERCHTMITAGDPERFLQPQAFAAVNDTFPHERGLFSEDESPAVCAVGALLAYIRETQMCAAFARELVRYDDGQFMEIDFNTRRNLELTETMRNKEKRGSLLWVLDKTETSMGARKLREWVSKPLLHPAQIMRRQASVAAFYNAYLLREELQSCLSRVLDLERLTAKAVYGTANAKDLFAIGQSLREVPSILSLLREFDGKEIGALCERIDPLTSLSDTLCRAIDEKAPLTVREGGMIRDGYNDNIDYLRSIEKDSQAWIKSIEEQERELTGIKTLRVSDNKVFGYYIEVTKSYLDMVPDRYIRKQTLTNCERFITQELKEMESTILGARDKLAALEYQLFEELRHMVIDNANKIQATASALAELDVFLSFATVASDNRYVMPEIDADSEIVIRDGRHPVVEQFVTDAYFVPNDTTLDTKNNRLMLITGPNMAGKSTYMRQVALITLMAQIGSFVPAASAKIGIVDKLFTRVGASDDLASGQSTFMLEMTEVSYILKNATERSLIIYDEVGRGTSTYDGMSIARAVVEYTSSKNIGAKTLFATHYHELTVLEGKLEGVVNYHIAAKKRGDSVTFLRRIVRGATDDSFGIEVAKLAGVPDAVVRRAREILAEIEEAGGVKTPLPVVQDSENGLFAGLADEAVTDMESEAADKIRAIDVNTLTPIEALNLVYSLKNLLDRR